MGPHPITKTFSIAAFCSLTFAPEDEPHGIGTVGATAGPGSTKPPNAQTVAAAAASSVAMSPPVVTRGACGNGMILVEGDHCLDAEQVCIKWLDPPPYQNLRCGEYVKPATCKSARVHRRFCIDREEFAETNASRPAEDAVPIVGKNWGEAKALCEARSARLCKETEWEFACEGPEMSPYPYGWKRDSTICNLDKTSLGGLGDKLKDLRAPLRAFPECKSPFGIHDMVGNVDEWVERENMAAPNRSALRGGWWLPGRNRCRAATLSHGEDYSGKQVGFRCCKDALASL